MLIIHLPCKNQGRYLKIGASKNSTIIRFNLNGPWKWDGDTLSRVDDNLTVTAEEDGIVQKISPTHIYFPGDEVIEVIPNSFVSFY